VAKKESKFGFLKITLSLLFTKQTKNGHLNFREMEINKIVVSVSNIKITVQNGNILKMA